MPAGSPHLQEAAFLEDVADELVQVHEALVVADVVGEDGQHHGVLRRDTREEGRVNHGKRRHNLRIWSCSFEEVEMEEEEEDGEEEEEDKEKEKEKEEVEQGKFIGSRDAK